MTPGNTRSSSRSSRRIAARGGSGGEKVTGRKQHGSASSALDRVAHFALPSAASLTLLDSPTSRTVSHCSISQPSLCEGFKEGMERAKEKMVMTAEKDSINEHVGVSDQKMRPTISPLTIRKPPPFLRQRGNSRELGEGEEGEWNISASFLLISESFLLISSFPSSHTILFTGGSFDAMHDRLSPRSFPSFLLRSPDDDGLLREEHGGRHQKQPYQQPWSHNCSLAADSEEE